MKLKNIFKNIDENIWPTEDEIIYLLLTKDRDLKTLYKKADDIRKQYMGNKIFLRGIVEFSNFCKKDCYYCGIQQSNKNVRRYRMADEEIIQTCKQIEKFGQTTVVLQSGEDFFYTKEKLGSLIENIKKETNLAITISVGERDKDTYLYWQKKGMDRYLIRFETSNRELFKKCHPDDDLDTRIICIETLKNIGIQTGSGFLIGLPSEEISDLARDIIFCSKLDLDMIGVGPFIPHDKTSFSKTLNPFENEIYFKTIAILRLLNKDAHIPATTAYDAVDPEGRNLLLQMGCNVFMPNSTPQKYRKDYLLYPKKPCVDESATDCSFCVESRIKSLGRTIGKGPGHSIHKKTF